jgi:hypothetical protein
MSPVKIRLSRTYQIVTPESAESGYCFEDVQYTLREAIALLYSHPIPSSDGVPRWASSHPQIDYRTGAQTIYSVHPSDDPVTQRHWPKVLRAAGVKKSVDE